MAKTPVLKSEFPDVPRANGVPSIFRDPTQFVFTVRLLQADVATILRSFQGPEWGVFTSDGIPVAIPDSVITVDFRREWRLSDYPIEQGGFETYDKVAVPYDARVRLSCDGTNTPRQLFLSQLDNAAQSMDLFMVSTPDAVYTNVSIIHMDYRRSRDSGISMIQVDLWLEQVRPLVHTEFTNTKEAEGVENVSAGPVQAISPTPAQAAEVTTPSPMSTGPATGIGTQEPATTSVKVAPGIMAANKGAEVGSGTDGVIDVGPAFPADHIPSWKSVK